MIAEATSRERDDQMGVLDENGNLATGPATNPSNIDSGQKQTVKFL